VTSDNPLEDGAKFTRDRLTLLAYGMAISFGFGVSVMGPAMPAMREDLGLSRTIGGLHFTALAVGAIVAGFLVDRFSATWGRRNVFWLGGTGVALGTLLIGLGWHPVVTMCGAIVVGFAGISLVTSSEAALADRHPVHRPVALTEVNIAISVGSVIPALLVGGSLAIGAGWRPPLVLPLLILVLHRLVYRAEIFPPLVATGPARITGELPGAYWFFWAAFVPSVAAEWSLGAWGAGYLVDVAGTSEGAASFLMAAFFGAMLVGRFIGGGLARVIGPMLLLAGTSAVGLGGFLLFWASESVVVVVGGLLVAGLGISMQFPMLLSLAIGTAPQRVDTASARISISSGASILVGPLLLGAIADQAGLRSAFAVVPGLFVVVFVLAALGRRADAMSRRDASSPQGT